MIMPINLSPWLTCIVLNSSNFIGLFQIAWTDMEPVNDAENTIQKLCEQANAEHNQGKLREVRSRLKSFLHEHASLLISMSEDTYQALRRHRGLRARHPDN